jgi:hypothetical protein
VAVAFSEAALERLLDCEGDAHGEAEARSVGLVDVDALALWLRVPHAVAHDEGVKLALTEREGDGV